MFEATETVSVDVAETEAGDNIMLLGLESALRPDDPVADKDMVPVNPFKPLRVTGDVVEDPARIDMEGFVAMVKSTTITEMRTEWESEPLVPVMFAV